MNWNTMRFDQVIYKSEYVIRGVHYFDHYCDHEFKVSIPATEPFYALAINCASSSDTFSMGEMEYVVPEGHFTIISIYNQSIQWTFKEGNNTIFLVYCEASFMSKLIHNYPWLEEERMRSNNFSNGVLIPKAYVLTPSMEDSIERMLYRSDCEGLLNSMYMESKAMDLIFSALQSTDDHFRGKVDEASIVEVKRVHEYMSEHLEEIRDADQVMSLVNMPLERFQSVFGLLYMMTPTEALQRERLQAAESMLRYSDEDIFEISQRAGFMSFGNFLEAFSNRFGMHPLTFRQEYGE